MVKAWKIILAAIVFMIIAQVIHTIESIVTMNYYTNPTYFAVWSKIMMPTAGPPPAAFYYYSLAFSFIGGLFFAGVYSVIVNGIPGKNILNKGLIYGLLIWLVAGIPGSLSLILLVNLPIDLVIYWTVTSLIVYLLAGVTTARISK